MRIVLRVIAIAVAVAVATFLVPGITLSGPTLPSRLVTLLAVAVVIGLINLLIKPIVTFVSGCLIVLTLGLFLLVVNALMLMLASAVAQWFGFGFFVDGFWPALFGSIIISIVSGLMSGVLGVQRPEA